jgi:hypothetical protein
MPGPPPHGPRTAGLGARYDHLMAGTVNLTQIVQGLGNFGSLGSPLLSILDQAKAGIRKKIAQTCALVD